MLAYTLRRILIAIPVLWAVATITFFLMHAVPGSPVQDEKSRPPALQAALERRYNLDEPVWKQYTLYLWNVSHGDLGISFEGDRDVAPLAARAFFITAQVGVLAFILAVVVGMTLGVLSALNHNGPGDYVGVFFATIGASAPNFIMGAFLILATIQFDLPFKLAGWGGPQQVSDIFNFSEYDWSKMVLPVIAISTLSASYIARVTRASMLEVLSQDYVRTARAKGLREYVVITRHTIKNAMIPVLTVMGPTFAFLISGSFIIETMFTINGLGKLSIDAIASRDYGMIMGTTLIYAFVVVFVNLAVDLAYAVVDPRIRYR
jgi:oligopeptide transport system permease protein